MNKLQLFRRDIAKPDFKMAVFDEKESTRYSQIVAVSGNLLCFWKIRDIMNGQLETTNIKDLSHQIVKSEFVFNKDKLLTAFKDQYIVFNDEEQDY